MPLLVRATLTLFTVAFIASLGLYFCNAATRGQIAAQKAALIEESLSMVLPQAEPEQLVRAEGDDPPYWVWNNNGQTQGYAFIASGEGYSGVIRIMVGTDTEGNTLGIRVLEQTETPGLGARMQEVPSSGTIWSALLSVFDQAEQQAAERPKPWFEEMFVGVEVDEDVNVLPNPEWTTLSRSERAKMRDDNTVTAISGATISTRTVAEAIERAFEQVQDKEQAG